ncbi:hypothetical protein N7457_003385 [Penicillium paradoxum]|uniref:uncharacterized protein n=1 Tax=Penicillium paradoxum TaxID=176176 RepID=UPI002548FAC6|nr:uncharacterized protein N7457_003385 [Penicillium paradoxum]KAJ5788395.1 hypothetical protein N7457_003385 [Penicillium paradoxum]
MSEIEMAAKSRRQQNSLACEECRSRKLKCDMSEPQCGSCCNLGLTCIANPLRRPRGPRKGHVKILKSRIGTATLERQLYGNVEVHPGSPPEIGDNLTCDSLEVDRVVGANIGDAAIDHVGVTLHGGSDCMERLMSAQPTEFPEWAEAMPLYFESESNRKQETISNLMLLAPSSPLAMTQRPTLKPALDASVVLSDLDSRIVSFTPPVPVQITQLECADLDDMFFDRAYLFAPIINRQRYFARAPGDLGESKAFYCLQNAMRLLAGSLGSQFKPMLPILYTHTSAILDSWLQDVLDEPIPIEIIQAQLLLALYEILKDNPQKGWTSAGKCFLLIRREKLHQIDNPSISRSCRISWVEDEERRRTFWTAYALERYANLVHGQPLALDDQLILTRLPAIETAFLRKEGIMTEFLPSAMSQNSNQPLSAFARSMVVVTILARCLAHQNQCNVERITDPTSKEYLARHRALDKALTREIEGTSCHDSTDLELRNSTNLFIEMITEAAVIVLFNALGRVSERPGDLYRAYEKRACKAAEGIRNQAQSLNQLGFFKIHPFTPIALFICGGFTRLGEALNPQADEHLKEILCSLQYLATANNLAGILHLELKHKPRKEIDNEGVVGFW